MRIPFLAMVATACVIGEPRPDDGGQFGEEGAACVAVERTALALDEESALGFAPQALLDAAAGEHAATLTWASGGSTPVAIGVEHAGGAVELVDYEYLTADGEPSAMEMGCADLVEIEVDVTFATEDGAFAEAWAGRITSALEGEAGFAHDLDAVAGTFDPWDHAPAGSDYDEMRAWVSIRFASGVASGAVDGQGSGVVGDPDDPESAAYAENVAIATF